MNTLLVILGEYKARNIKMEHTITHAFTFMLYSSLKVSETYEYETD